MMSTVGICQKILCWLPDVKRLNGNNLKVYTKLFRCKSARMQGKKPLDLIWSDIDKSVGPAHKKISIETVCKRIHDEEAR